MIEKMPTITNTAHQTKNHELKDTPNLMYLKQNKYTKYLKASKLSQTTYKKIKDMQHVIFALENPKNLSKGTLVSKSPQKIHRKAINLKRKKLKAKAILSTINKLNTL